VDHDLRYPEDLTGEIYHDGLIWSRALWDIRHALGHVKADTIILEGIFGYDPYVTMLEAADATVKAAERLYGRATAKAVARVFQTRGILP
jgi:Zn-dependent metalloprotease